eukprot:3101393-Prymnesium_polylepis.2
MQQLACESDNTGKSDLLLDLHRNGELCLCVCYHHLAWHTDAGKASASALEGLPRHGREHGVRQPLSWVSSHTELPALEPLLSNTRLASVIHGYLGGSARYDGHVTFRISEGLGTDEYASGHWHHDRCGRRIRLAILLHDVSDDGLPTVVAGGSHNNLYFSYLGHRNLTRFTDAHVRSRYTVTAMTGKQGGGFLLDTNALHAGQLKGRSSRTVVFLEFHPHGKLPLLHRDSRGKDMPCPSRRSEAQAGSTRADFHWPLGKPGYPLYPPDVDLRSEVGVI